MTVLQQAQCDSLVDFRKLGCQPEQLACQPELVEGGLKNES